jgi:hypothetical protein
LKKLLWLVPVSFILYACPFESPTPMERGPVEPVDSALLGYWYGIVKDGSDFFGIEALDISQKTDSTYSIVRYGKAAKGDMILPDTAYFTGFTSYVNSQRYMNVEGALVTVETRRNKPPKVTSSKIYYIANFALSHDTLTMKTVTENFAPASKTLKTPEELKQIVSGLTAKQKNIFDELYSLSYRKIQKPSQPKPF